MILERQFYMVW